MEPQWDLPGAHTGAIAIAHKFVGDVGALNYSILVKPLQNRDAQPGVEQRLQVVVGQSREDAQLDVRQRAHGQRDPCRCQALDQRRIVDAANAVVDSLHAQQVDRGGDVRRGPLLAGMRDDVQAQLAALREDARELLRRVAALARVEPDADDLPGVGELSEWFRFLATACPECGVIDDPLLSGPTP